MIQRASTFDKVGSAIERTNPQVQGLQVIPVQEMGSNLIESWRSIRNRNARLMSPYFDPEFTKAVGRVRNDVHVGVVHREGSIAEILPFQNVGHRQIGPVGGLLNDVQGVVSESGEFCELAHALMRKTGSSSFPFHSLANYENHAEYQFRKVKSYFLDLAGGWKNYQSWVNRHSSTISRQRQKTRGLERNVGPIRFEFDVLDADLLERLIDLKRAKYQRTRAFDILSVPWTADLLREIFATNKPGFRGILSGLWAGDHLVAVHFGMLTDSILHYWFPVFVPEFSKYSPGTELLLRVTETAANRGISKIDLGYGDEPYKLKFANGVETLDCGQITNSRLAFMIARQKNEFRHRLKQIPFKSWAKFCLRSVFPEYGRWNYR